MPKERNITTRRRALAADDGKALVAITLDLEMSMHYPRRAMTEWNYEKGNLDEPTKQYTREACRRVKGKGGVLHAFVLGRTLEQKRIDWIRQIIRDGHPVSNHTYDHVNVMARRTRDLQYRFRRAPWLIHGKTAREVIMENIRMTTRAMATRLGVASVGFRTPYGFPNGLSDRPDVQDMLLQLGFEWVTSKAVDHVMKVRQRRPTPADFATITQAQKHNQPTVYPSGLVEIPASPMGDVFSFRERRWTLNEFLEMIEQNVRWAIKHRALYDFFSHPSILCIEDPEFRAIELICDLVGRAGDRAAIVDMDTIALRAKLRCGCPIASAAGNTNRLPTGVPHD